MAGRAGTHPSLMQEHREHLDELTACAEPRRGKMRCTARQVGHLGGVAKSKAVRTCPTCYVIAESALFCEI